MKLKKMIVVDGIPADIVAREHGEQYFPLKDFMKVAARDNVDVIETLVTVQVRVPEDDSPEAKATIYDQFERKRHALEMSGAKVIRCPAKRTPGGGFKQSDDQRLMIKTMTMAMKLRPDFIVLVAADGDYAPMVEALREEGIRTEVVASPKMLASELVRQAVNVADLDEIIGLIIAERS